ncbi:MAG: hypothetical protein ABSG18_09525 [Steroidobacteraceae bacterium]
MAGTLDLAHFVLSSLCPALYNARSLPRWSEPLMVKFEAILTCVIFAALPAWSADQPLATVQAPDDAVDARRPLPLLPMMAAHQKQMMREHLGAVQEIVAALGSNDFDAVQRSANRLGFSAEVGQMCEHMGAASPAFTQQALAFHHTADRIAAAARDHDRSRVLAELSTTLQACKACHAAWKQDIVNEATWQKLTLLARSGGRPRE